MTDFYVTLPSNVPNSAFNNTTSRYITRLPEVLQLRRDEWAVALTDLVYPYSFVNVGRTLHYWIHFKNQPPVRVSFPSAQYLDLEHIINTLNKKPQFRKRRAAVEEMFEAKKKRGISIEHAQHMVDLLNQAKQSGIVTNPREEEEANALAGLITAGAVVANTVIREEEEEKRNDEANALAGLITTATVVANTAIADDRKKKAEDQRKKKKEEQKKIEEEQRKEQERIEEEQKRIEEERKKEQKRVEEEQKRIEEKRKKEEERKKNEELAKEEERKKEELKKMQNLVEQLASFRDGGGLSKYKELAEAVLNKPKDPATYKDLLVDFEMARSLVAIEDSTYDTSSLFHFEEEAGKLKVVFDEPDNILFLEFEKACSYFLGFDDTIVRTSMVAPHNADMFGDISVIYLYSDLVDPIIVGNKKSNLLSVVPCTGQYGSIVYYTVPAPRYIPLLNSNIDSIRIELLTGSGEPVPFSWGTTVAVLHFKKIK